MVGFDSESSIILQGRAWFMLYDLAHSPLYDFQSWWLLQNSVASEFADFFCQVASAYAAAAPPRWGGMAFEFHDWNTILLHRWLFKCSSNQSAFALFWDSTLNLRIFAWNHVAQRSSGAGHCIDVLLWINCIQNGLDAFVMTWDCSALPSD
jgi:hypothetical protein